MGARRLGCGPARGVKPWEMAVRERRNSTPRKAQGCTAKELEVTAGRPAQRPARYRGAPARAAPFPFRIRAHARPLKARSTKRLSIPRGEKWRARADGKGCVARPRAATKRGSRSGADPRTPRSAAPPAASPARAKGAPNPCCRVAQAGAKGYSASRRCTAPRRPRREE